MVWWSESCAHEISPQRSPKKTSPLAARPIVAGFRHLCGIDLSHDTSFIDHAGTVGPRRTLATHQRRVREPGPHFTKYTCAYYMYISSFVKTPDELFAVALPFLAAPGQISCKPRHPTSLRTRDAPMPLLDNPCNLPDVLSGWSAIAARSKRSDSPSRRGARTLLSGQNRPDNSPADPAAEQTQTLLAKQLPTAHPPEPSAVFPGR
jgi:hypothetical protein